MTFATAIKAGLKTEARKAPGLRTATKTYRQYAVFGEGKTTEGLDIGSLLKPGSGDEVKLSKGRRRVCLKAQNHLEGRRSAGW